MDGWMRVTLHATAVDLLTRLLFYLWFRLSQGYSRSYTGMKLAEHIVQLTAMLESEDLRHFESNM